MTTEVISLLSKIKNDTVFDDFYFVGGTALAHYLNHRISHDLDFISTAKLKPNSLKALAIRYDAIFVPDSFASAFKINTGKSLDEYKMTFNIDGVKIEFFYPNNTLQNEIVSKYKDESVAIGGVIKTLPLKAIAELKILAFLRRHKIRDLFDIFAMLEQRKIVVDDLERLYAVEIGEGTLVEFVENFSDDGSESLDFGRGNIYYERFTDAPQGSKMDLIKSALIDLIVKEEIAKKIKNENRTVL